MRLLLLALIASSIPGRAFAAPSPASEEQLLLETRALLDDPCVRPVASPVPGSFSALAQPTLAELTASVRRMENEPVGILNLRNRVFEGELPLSALPALWVDEAAREQAQVEALLRATHAEQGTPPRSFTLFGQLKRRVDAGPVAALHAAKLADVLALQALARGERRRAAEICADEISLARDVSRGRVGNQMVAVAIVAFASRTCRTTIAQLTAADRAWLGEQLALSQAGFYPLEKTLQQEKVFAELTRFRDTLSSATAAALPPEASLEPNAREPVSFTESARRAVFGGWARRSAVESLDELSAAVQLAPSTCDATSKRLEAELPMAMTFAAFDAQTAEATQLVRRWRTGRARLAMLRAELAVRAARDQLGRWPRSVAEVGGVWFTDPRTDLALELVPLPAGARIVPAWDGARTLDDLAIVVR